MFGDSIDGHHLPAATWPAALVLTLLISKAAVVLSGLSRYDRDHLSLCIGIRSGWSVYLTLCKDHAVLAYFIQQSIPCIFEVLEYILTPQAPTPEPPRTWGVTLRACSKRRAPQRRRCWRPSEGVQGTFQGTFLCQAIKSSRFLVSTSRFFGWLYYGLG